MDLVIMPWSLSFYIDVLFQKMCLHVCMCGVYQRIRMYVHRVYAGAYGGQKKMLDPWNWSYR